MATFDNNAGNNSSSNSSNNPKSTGLNNQKQNNKKTGGTWYTNPIMLVFVIGLPLIVVVGCIFFVIHAFRVQDATVRDDWYMDGKALYQDASKDQLAYDLGVAGNMSFDDTDGAVSFVLNFPSDSTESGTLRNGMPISYPEALTASISHATDKHKDRDFTLNHIKDNLYQGEVVLDDVPAKYYVQVSDERLGWRLIQAYKLPAKTVALTPLSAFGQSHQGLPDQRDKR